MRTTVTLLVLVLAALGLLVALASGLLGGWTLGGVARAGIYPTTPTPTTVLLPDLIPQSMQITLETGGDCDYTSTQLGVRVFFGNVGGADAGSFVVEVNGAQQTVSTGLAQGATDSLWFLGYVFGPDENVAVVDATFQVEESNEDNNTLAQIVPIPTLPSPCTPTPTATPTATGVAPATATPTATATGVAPATATPTASSTSTPTPTTPVGLVGDVDCDGEVNSIDAALILQFVAGLIGSLSCADAADTNGDGEVTAVDVALVLQFVAGLLGTLPP